MTKKPQVEITGLEARYYDSLMNMITFRSYESFIRRAINDVPVNPEDVVMDLGAGTGKNAGLMLMKMNEKAKIYAIEIGEVMRQQLAERQARDPRIIILNQRIEEPFLLPEPATLTFMSFVIHGLKQEIRLKAIQNVYNNLADNGRFCILDYNHFNVSDAPWYVRFGIRRIECETTEDFILRDWSTILQVYGYTDFITHTYLKGYIRLLCCRKSSLNHT